MELKKRVLFCLAPHSAILKKNAYSEHYLGPSIAADVFYKAGFDVDFVDLNAILNDSRSDEQILDVNDLSVLSSSFFAVLYAQGKLETTSNRLQSLVDSLLAHVCGTRYDIIAVSVLRNPPHLLSYLTAMNFSLLLSCALKRRFGSPVIMGGSAFGTCPDNIAREHFSHITDDFVDYVFIGNRLSGLSTLLRILQSGSRKTAGISDVTFMGNRCIFKAMSLKLRVFRYLRDAIFFRFAFFDSLLDRFVACVYSKRPSPDTVDNELRVSKFFIDKRKSLYEAHPQMDNRLVEVLPGTFNSENDTPVTVYTFRSVLGCCNRCSFCRSAFSEFYALKPEEAVDQLERFIHENPGARYFRFFNNQLNFSPKYALSFADELIRRRLDIRFSDSACLRSASSEVFDALKRAGCVKLWAGVETVSGPLLRGCNKNLSEEDIYRGVDLMHKAGLFVGGNIIVGMPFEAEADHQSNIDFIKWANDKVDCWSINLFMMYYDTPFFLFRGKFNVRHRFHYFPGDNSCFEETGMRAKEEREQTVIKRHRELCALLPDTNDLAWNDHLLFYMYDRFGGDKGVIRRVFKEYAENQHHHTRA